MSEAHVREDLGLRFVAALSAKDVDAMSALLHPEIEFRGVTPSRAWEAFTPQGVCEILFGAWFEPMDHIEETIEADSAPLADRHRLRYRLRVESEGTEYFVEQQGYYDAIDGRITRLSLMCSGFRPWPSRA